MLVTKITLHNIWLVQEEPNSPWLIQSSLIEKKEFQMNLLFRLENILIFLKDKSGRKKKKQSQKVCNTKLFNDNI